MEFVLNHDGQNWVAENEVVTFSDRTLEGLDEAIKRYVKNQGFLQKDETLQIFMAFDNTAIPQWMRQYAQHYFNRIVEIKG